MKKRIYALVCVVVLCLAYMSVGFAANCGHGTTTTQTTRRYAWISDSQHKYIETEVNFCSLCGTVFWTHDTTLFTEKHIKTGNAIVEIRGAYKYTYYLCRYCNGHCDTVITYK